ncbi:MAG TPA: hypothetical protein VNO26_00915 [Candidatus Limnocylindria bacterium]|nr:hypothetical protein [Candidatus Limnocylindria bacterium]
MSPLLHGIHVAALVVYLASTLWLLVLLAAVGRVADPAEQRRRLVRQLRPYNVLSVGAVGVLIISGASALTDMKALYGPGYVLLLWPLAQKLALTFLLTMVATYLSFGLAHRLVRAEQGRLPVEPAQLRSMLTRLRGGAYLALAVALWTSWVGYRLARQALLVPPAAHGVARP